MPNKTESIPIDGDLSQKIALILTRVAKHYELEPEDLLTAQKRGGRGGNPKYPARCFLMLVLSPLMSNVLLAKVLNSNPSNVSTAISVGRDLALSNRLLRLLIADIRRDFYN